MKHLKDMNWNRLYYFYEVARLKSIKAVSKHTEHSSSSISEQISKLEKDLELELFKRKRDGLLLTRQGEILFEHAQIIFEEGYRALEKFSHGDLGGYPVLVGVDSAIFDPLASNIISRYWDVYAKYGVVNTAKQADDQVLIENIMSENIDWGLSLSPSKRKTLTSYPMDQLKVSYCCAPFMLEKFKKKIFVTQHLPFLESAYNHPYREVLKTQMRADGVIINEYAYSDNFDYVISLLKKGRAFSVLPDQLIKKIDGVKAFNLGEPFYQSVFAIWKNKNEKLISISVLKKMLSSKLSQQRASKYLQIEVGEVPKDKLRSNP